MSVFSIFSHFLCWHEWYIFPLLFSIVRWHVLVCRHIFTILQSTSCSHMSPSSVRRSGPLSSKIMIDGPTLWWDGPAPRRRHLPSCLCRLIAKRRPWSTQSHKAWSMSCTYRQYAKCPGNRMQITTNGKETRSKWQKKCENLHEQQKTTKTKYF